MDQLLPSAGRIGALLKARGETVAVSESSSGGLVAAALLSVPGASAYFIAGAVVYTGRARETLLRIGAGEMAGMNSASPPYAALLARTVRERFAVTWGVAETGAAGPSGNRYGDAAGHTCLAGNGPAVRARTLETGGTERVANMLAFAAATLDLLAEALEAAR